MRTTMAWVAALLSLGGCGAEVSVDEFCAQLGDEGYCQQQKACGIASSEATCDAVLNNTRPGSLACDAPLRAAISSGFTRFDRRLAARCVQETQTQCGSRPSCAEVLRGTSPLGFDCRSPAECTEGWCDRTSTCPGVCRAFAPGDMAVASPEACGALARVTLLDGGTVCRARRSTGAACEGDSDCEVPLGCRAGKCAARAAAGGACPCAAGLRCDFGTCRPWARSGEGCTNEFLGDGGTVCQLGLACRGGVCGTALANGEGCSDNPNRCGAGLSCRGTPRTCVPKSSTEAACSSSFDCEASLVCLEGKCAAPREVDEPCDAVGDCRLGLSCEGGACKVPVCSPAR